MKKYLIMALTAMLLGGAAASAKTAQTASKGKADAPATKQYIGGSFSLWYEAGQNGSSGAFTAAIVPTYGWSFNKSWGIGVAAGYERTFTDGATVNSAVLRPYVRWTYLNTSRFHLFLDGGFSLITGSVSTSGGGSSNGTLVFKFGVTPGLMFDMTENFSLVAHVGFVGVQAANDNARAAGYSRGGGVQLTPNTLDFGLIYNF